MQLRFRKSTKGQGSTLMVTLFMVSLTGFFIFAYLDLARAQRNIEARSQAWNAALAMAEAGIEEALSQVNPGVSVLTIDRSANGWGTSGGGFYGPVARTLPNGSYGAVISSDTFPFLYATGYVSVPSIPAIISRTLRVGTTNAPLFSAVLAAKHNINMGGNNIFTDSFNSANTNQSDNGRYPFLYPSRASTNGDVASVSGLVNVGNSDINGQLLLGPTGSDNVSSNGKVTGGITNDFNYEFEDVVMPQTNWFQPFVTNSMPIGTNNYQYVFGPGLPYPNNGGNYIVDNLNGNLYISNVNVTLKLTGSATPGVIWVAGSGTTAGKLTIYMDGPSFKVNGSSVVDGGLAASLCYYGTTNNTSITFGGNASFTGTIYAPEATLTQSGGGSSTYDFVGAAVLSSANINGHFSFHYDESLATTGPKRGYLPVSWTEL